MVILILDADVSVEIVFEPLLRLRVSLEYRLEHFFATSAALTSSVTPTITAISFANGHLPGAVPRSRGRTWDSLVSLVTGLENPALFG